jgi:Rod binding domain-containing protein
MRISEGREQTEGVLAGFRPSPRLVQAAHEFEGQMMKELLKPIAEDTGLNGDDAGGSNGAGVLSEFAGEALGQALSQRGGFGIADRIIAQLSRSGNSIEWNERISESAQRKGMRNVE